MRNGFIPLLKLYNFIVAKINGHGTYHDTRKSEIVLAGMPDEIVLEDLYEELIFADIMDKGHGDIKSAREMAHAEMKQKMQVLRV